jgi:beta-glucosidase-like glycosyl hydrolase
MAGQRLLLAQSIFPRLNCNQYRISSEYREEVDRLVESAAVGGFVLFDGDIETVHGVVGDLRALSGNTLLFAADCEDGVTMRFAGGTEFPSMMALGAANDVAATYSVSRSIAREMRAIGIGWNFAPVADINTNPDNPIINIRSFGEEATLVSDHVHAYLRGMQDGGVAACAKHFPGHGDTRADSHREIPVLEFDERRLNSVEIYPFREAIRNGVKSVMVAHVAVPAIDPSMLPATLSRLLTGDLLRRQLGFKGVIVTDAMDMNAITDAYSPADAAVMAYNAGADVLEVMPDPAAALSALVAAAAAGTIEARRIKETSARIAALKKWVAAYQDEGAVTLQQSRKGHEVIALEAARRSINLNGRLRKLYPPLVVLAFVDTADNPKPDEWFGYFSSWYPGQASGAIVTPEVTPDDQRDLLATIDSAGSVIAVFFVRPRSHAGTIGLTPDQTRIADAAFARPTVMLNFGNPYLLRDSDPQARIDAYSASSASLAASIEALERVVK